MCASDRIRDTYSIVKEKVPKEQPIAPSVRVCAGKTTVLTREEGCDALLLGIIGMMCSRPSFEPFPWWSIGRNAAKLLNDEGDLFVLRR